MGKNTAERSLATARSDLACSLIENQCSFSTWDLTDPPPHLSLSAWSPLAPKKLHLVPRATHRRRRPKFTSPPVDGIHYCCYLGSIFSAFKSFAAIFCLVVLKSCQGSVLCFFRRCGTVSMVKPGSFNVPVSSFHANGVDTVAPSRALAE